MAVEENSSDTVFGLCVRGLEKYRLGDVDGALIDWDRARVLEPDAETPRLYFERVAHGMDPEDGSMPSGLDLPRGVATSDEAEDYEEIELTAGDPIPDLAGEHGVNPHVGFDSLLGSLDGLELDGLDAGWILEDEVAALPPPPLSPSARSSLERSADDRHELSKIAAGIMGVPDDALEPTGEEALPDVDELPVAPARGLPGATDDTSGAAAAATDESPEERAVPAAESAGAADDPGGLDLVTGANADAQKLDVARAQVPSGEYEGDTLDLPRPPPSLGGMNEYADVSTVELRRPALLKAVAPGAAGVPVAVPAFLPTISPPGASSPDGEGAHTDNDNDTDDQTESIHSEPDEDDAENSEELTVPGGGDDGLPDPQQMVLSADALSALGGPAEGSRGTEDTTVERPGVMAPALVLPDLDELELGARVDDRHPSSTELNIAFRERMGTDGDVEEEMTVERRVLGDVDDEEMTIERAAFASKEEPTVERPAISDRADGPLSLGDELSKQTIQTMESGAAGVASPLVIVEPGYTSSERGTSQGFGQRDGLAGSESSWGGELSGDWDERIDQVRDQVTSSLPEAEREHVAKLVGAFIDRARLEMDRGQSAVAMLALELALGEDPGSPAVQKLLHRHRELLLESYRQFLGDGSAVPTLAVPMHELPAQRLDSRAVFLLSRVEGTFTVEELLDVSGMPQLETYRHLSRLLIQGILQLR